jgi:hypothetical protein
MVLMPASGFKNRRLDDCLTMETIGHAVFAFSEVLRVLWDVIRLLILGVLALVAGVARTVLGGLAFFSL